MKAELIPLLTGDRGVTEAARVSFASDGSDYPDYKMAGLISYLYVHKHWSPFGHCRELFGLGITKDDWLHFLENANLAGFTWAKEGYGHDVLLNGSLWAWYQNLGWLPSVIQSQVWKTIKERYPVFVGMVGDEHVTQQGRTPVGYAEPLALPQAAALKFPGITYAAFRVEAPVFVARQLVKHQVHLTWNEESRRYIKSEPTLFRPEKFLGKPEASIKQGSSGAEVEYARMDDVVRVQNECVELYLDMIEAGVAPEDARMVLPLNMETHWIWTGSLLAWKRVLTERLHPTAQTYTRRVAESMFEQLSEAFPGTWTQLWSAVE